MREREIAAHVERALQDALRRFLALAREDVALEHLALDVDADLATITGAELERRVAGALVTALARRIGGAAWR